jgi:hypothetical protein
MNLIKKINYDDEGIYDITYFNNGREISFDNYIKIENALEEDFEDELAEYNYDNEPSECQCIDCILERYIERLQEVGIICPCCAREILLDLIREIDC